MTFKDLAVTIYTVLDMKTVWKQQQKWEHMFFNTRIWLYN